MNKLLRFVQSTTNNTVLDFFFFFFLFLEAHIFIFIYLILRVPYMVKKEEEKKRKKKRWVSTPQCAGRRSTLAFWLDISKVVGWRGIRA
jgi:hypothetical protein